MKRNASLKEHRTSINELGERVTYAINTENHTDRDAKLVIAHRVWLSEARRAS